MGKGNGGTRTSTKSNPTGLNAAPRALSGPELWAYNRAQAPAEISRALEDAGFRATIQRDGQVTAGMNFYDDKDDKPVDVKISVGLYNAEDKNYIVNVTKVKTLDRYQVTNNGGRGNIAIGSKVYSRTKKLNDIYNTLPEAMEQIKKFTKKF